MHSLVDSVRHPVMLAITRYLDIVSFNIVHGQYAANTKCTAAGIVVEVCVLNRALLGLQTEIIAGHAFTHHASWSNGLLVDQVLCMQSLTTPHLGAATDPVSHAGAS